MVKTIISESQEQKTASMDQRINVYQLDETY